MHKPNRPSRKGHTEALARGIISFHWRSTTLARLDARVVVVSAIFVRAAFLVHKL